jgi:hypothetical protein
MPQLTAPDDILRAAPKRLPKHAVLPLQDTFSQGTKQVEDDQLRAAPRPPLRPKPSQQTRWRPADKQQIHRCRHPSRVSRIERDLRSGRAITRIAGDPSMGFLITLRRLQKRVATYTGFT